MASDEVWLEYHLPSLGSIKAKLFPLASNCYQLLEKKGHIDRLNRMDQLGVIRQIYQGAHHSRWEYVIAQIALIYQMTILKKSREGTNVVQSVGLSSNTHFSDLNGGNSSGADILQCWVMLLNFGHLSGTFSTELGFLRSLQTDTKLKRAFLSKSGKFDIDANNYILQVIDENKVFDFHKAISFFLLSRYAKKSDKKLAEILIAILKWYVFENKSHEVKRQNLLRLFKRIRQLCYLSLDSFYTPTPMKLDLGAIFLNLEDRSFDLCAPSKTPLCREMDGFNDLMGREIYNTARVLLQHEAHSNYIQSYIKGRYYENDENKRLKPYEISDMRKLIVELQNDTTKAPIPIEYNTTLCLPMTKSYYFNTPYNTDDIMKYMKKTCGQTKLDIAVVTDASYNGSNVAIGIAKTINHGHIIKCFIGLILTMNKLIDDQNMEISKNQFDMWATIMMQSPICKEWSSEIVENLMELLTNRRCQYRFRTHEPPIAFVCRGSKKCAMAIEVISERISDSQKRHEIQTHAKALKAISVKSSLISCISSVDVTNQNGKSVTDIDGLSLLVNENELWILYVEAKDQHSGSVGAAKSQLATRFKDTGLWDICSHPIIQEIPQNGAYIFAKVQPQ